MDWSDKMGYIKKEENELEESIPMYKKILCGDNLFGNIFYPFWRGIDCPCCTFFRGMVVGTLLGLVVNLMVWVM
jgi:hypothetical protein